MEKLKIYLSVLLVMISGVYFYPVNAQMIANITEDVSTDFGVYHPYAAHFTPMVPTFTVASDFSNVINYQDMSLIFNPKDDSLLLQNYFTVKKSQYQQLYDIYNLCTWSGTPIFVTTDAVLHIYHSLFDRLLAKIELQYFFTTLNQLTETMLNETQIQLTQTEKALTTEAVYSNLAFLCVPTKLLNGPETTIPDTVSSLVDSELVYKQMMGTYRVKSPHIALLMKRITILKSQLNLSIELIPREENKLANRLAQKASKRKKVKRQTFKQLPL